LPQGREVEKLGPVGDTVLRGAQPSLRAFETLKEMGVDTVINLRPESDYERKVVDRLGMRYFYMPLPPLDKPTHDLTLAFLSAATDPENGKVFFHCYHGVDRTGTMAACLRIARDDWNVDDALAEMRAYKVHESGQRAKVAYLQEFSEFWHALPLAERCTVLHRPLPEEAIAQEPVKRPWWRRVAGWFGERVAELKGEAGG
jgi:protein tyrosine/serine phosphatase